MTRAAFICAGVRTPVGRFGGALASQRPDDLAALTIRDVLARAPSLDPQAVDDVILGCAKQADDAEQVNPNGGAIALGHPLRTLCIGVGQGIALLLERL